MIKNVSCGLHSFLLKIKHNRKEHECVSLHLIPIICFQDINKLTFR